MEQMGQHSWSIGKERCQESKQSSSIEDYSLYPYPSVRVKATMVMTCQGHYWFGLIVKRRGLTFLVLQQRKWEFLLRLFKKNLRKKKTSLESGEASANTVKLKTQFIVIKMRRVSLLYSSWDEASWCLQKVYWGQERERDAMPMKENKTSRWPPMKMLSQNPKCVSERLDHKTKNLKNCLKKIIFFPRKEGGEGVPLHGKFHENNYFLLLTLP